MSNERRSAGLLILGYPSPHTANARPDCRAHGVTEKEKGGSLGRTAGKARLAPSLFSTYIVSQIKWELQGTLCYNL